jgi:hypothetical protein
VKKDLSILFSWIVRYGHVFIVFIIFPLFIFSYGKVTVQKDYSDIVASPVSIIVSEVNKSRILSQQEASYLENINNNIANNWTSDTDQKYELRVGSDNAFSEYYSDDKFGWGEWRVYSATSTGSSTVTVDTVKPLYIKNAEDTYKFYLERIQRDPDSKGEKYLYEVYFVDPFKLILVRVDNSKILSFVRSSSTITTKKNHQ